MTQPIITKVFPSAVLSLFTAVSVATTGQAATKLWSTYHTSLPPVKPIAQIEDATAPAPTPTETPAVNRVAHAAVVPAKIKTPTPTVKPPVIPTSRPFSVVPTSIPTSTPTLFQNVQLTVTPVPSVTKRPSPTPELSVTPTAGSVFFHGEDDHDTEDWSVAGDPNIDSSQEYNDD